MKKKLFVNICAAACLLAGIYSCSKDNEVEEYASKQNAVTTRAEIREILNIEMETAGTIAELIGAESTTVQKLVITGPINAADVDTIRKLPQLVALDLKGATICSSDETYSIASGSRNEHYQLNDNEIGEYMFCETNLGEIILPDNIVAIGRSAFYSLEGTTDFPFQTIDIPEGVAYIGEYAFNNCDYLKSVTLPSTLKSIENYTFNQCENLSNVDLGGVEHIGQRAFEKCKSLTNIELSENIKTLDYRCFAESGLTSISIPGSVTSFGNELTENYGNTFYGCTSLQTAVLPENMTEIPTSMFNVCRQLKSVNIPQGVTRIRDAAFRECNALSEIILSDVLETIGYATFQGCGFKTITLPETLTSIGEFAFSSCSSLTSIILPPNLTQIAAHTFSSCTSLTDITFPSNLTLIGEGAFSRTGLKEITIPASVGAIGRGCFSGCNSLEAVYFPESSIEQIYQGCFQNCENLSHIELPQELKIIDSNSFRNCTSLKQITLPETLESIFGEAFFGSSLEELILPNGLKSIGNSALAGNRFTTITIPESVTSVGERVFDHCEKLTAIFWNTSIDTSTDLFGPYNVNCLLYLADASTVVRDDNMHNVIINGVADEIIIYSTDRDFGVPQEFKALKISYTRNFSYPTYPGEASGWRSISLPFDVETITHEDGRTLAPFNADVADAKPFWLRRLTANGFENVTQIEAGVPYIIAMPNNEAYEDEYNISGNVTFAAEDPYGITIPATGDMIRDDGPEFSFTANYSCLPASATIYALNQNSGNGVHAGSRFTRNTRSVLSFEGYVTNLGAPSNAPAFFSVGPDAPATRALKPLGPVPSIDDM